MAFSTRVALLAVVGLAGTAIAASAVPSRPAHADGGAVVAQVPPASPGPCTRRFAHPQPERARP